MTGAKEGDVPVAFSYGRTGSRAAFEMKNLMQAHTYIDEIGFAEQMMQSTNGGSMIDLPMIRVFLAFILSLGFVRAADLDDGGGALPEATRTIEVVCDRTLEQAIEMAQSGDHIILEDGRYDGFVLRGLRGTAERPIVFMAKNPRKALIAGSRHGRNVKVSDCEYVYFQGLRFTGADVWSLTIGPAYPGDTKTKGCRWIRILDCEFDHAGQSLLKINGNSGWIEVRDSEFHHSGTKSEGRQPYAEGIYIGEGATLTDRSHDILIQNNRFHQIGNEDNWGEAIDVKGQTYRVRILGNQIEDVVLDSGGAITVLFDPVDYPEGETDPQIVVSDNRIKGVRKRPGGWHGSGICVGANGILVEGNQVSETEGPAFLAMKNAANTTGQVRLKDNVFHGKTEINNYGQGLRTHSVIIIFEEEQSSNDLE